MRTPTSPRFSLVLGSGGVKSIAGLGAMEVFEQEGLRPSAVAGCSAGAIFGALVAAGHPARLGMEMARQLWSRDITSRKRHQALLEIALPRAAGFDDRFALRDDRLICQRLRAAFGDTRVEDLPLPLRIQTTCANTGKPVVLFRGHLADALRASVALPFLFAPKQIDGRLLVDGSLSDPLPVAAAPPGFTTVALGFRVPFPRNAHSASRLATRVTAALSNNLLDARLAATDASNTVLMLPELPRRIGLFDTDAMPELIELGRQAARAALPRLHLLLGQPVRLATMA
jgi:NTE family protein